MAVAIGKLKQQAFGMIAGLVLQYLLGMYTNMFVEFPEGGNVGQNWEFAKSNPVLFLHILLGTLLIVGSLTLLVRSYLSKNKNWKIATGFGFGGIIIAWVAGEEFIGAQNDQYSLVMSVAFLVALLSYCWGIYKSDR